MKTCPIHLLDEISFRDPGPALDFLHKGSPVVFDERTGAWLVHGYKEVALALKLQGLSARATPVFMAQAPKALRESLSELERHFDRWLVFSDGDDHHRIRDVLRPWYSPRQANLRKEAFDVLIQKVSARITIGVEFDFVSDFSLPVAVGAAALLLGLQGHDEHELIGIATDLISFIATPRPTKERGLRATSALRALECLVRKWSEDSDSLAFRCLSSGLSMDETVAVVAQVMTGSIDPISVAMTSSAALIADYRGETQLFVDEVIRYSTPFRLAPRVALCDITIGEVTIPSGSRVLLLLHGANSDPAVYDEPSLFQPIGRKRHMSFGAGEHYCLGATDARVLLEAAVDHLVERKMSVVGAGLQDSSFGSASWASLPVVLLA